MLGIIRLELVALLQVSKTFHNEINYTKTRAKM